MIDIRLINVLFFACLVFSSTSIAKKGPPLILLTIHTQDKNIPFQCEVALSPQQRSKGLMFRQNLADNQGMLFIFPADHSPSMWMKNTFITLDILFIDSEGIIFYIKENARPLSTRQIIPPLHLQKRTRTVLEIKGGSAHKLNIHCGARVTHSLQCQPQGQ